MNRRWIAAVLISGAVSAWLPAHAGDAPSGKTDKSASGKSNDGLPPASTQEEIDKMDKGIDTIDVSKYPKEQQDNYLVFAGKCSKCHTLARPINSPYALPEEWKAYVTKMSHKPRSGISEDSAKQIISFLTYDSSIRKKEIIEAKLKGKKDKPKDASGEKPKDDTPAK